MEIDEAKIFSAIADYNANSDKNKILRCVEQDGKKYLLLVDKTELGWLDKIRVFFKSRDFSQKKILSLAGRLGSCEIKTGNIKNLQTFKFKISGVQPDEKPVGWRQKKQYTLVENLYWKEIEPAVQKAAVQRAQELSNNVKSIF